MDAVIGRTRTLWEHLAGAGARFGPALRVTASPGARTCPPGWVGLLVIGDTVLATAPDQETGRRVEQALAGLPVTSLGDAALVEERLPVGDRLGPAVLAYLHPTDFRSWAGDIAAEELAPGHPDLSALFQAVSEDDLDESALGHVTSSAFVIRDQGVVVAASGYVDWPLDTAHLGVLAAATARGR